MLIISNLSESVVPVQTLLPELQKCLSIAVLGGKCTSAVEEAEERHVWR